MNRKQQRGFDRYIRNVTDDMARRGYLEIRIENGRRFYKLTDAGQAYYAQLKLDVPGSDPDGEECPN